MLDETEKDQSDIVLFWSEGLVGLHFFLSSFYFFVYHIYPADGHVVVEISPDFFLLHCC